MAGFAVRRIADHQVKGVFAEQFVRLAQIALDDFDAVGQAV